MTAIAAGAVTACGLRWLKQPNGSASAGLAVATTLGSCVAAAGGTALCAAAAFNDDIVDHVARVIAEAHSRGFTHLETARLYNTSEQVICHALDRLEGDGLLPSGAAALICTPQPTPSGFSGSL